MTERVTMIADQIRKLTPEEQADLLDTLLSSSMPDRAVEDEWAREAEARLDRFISGVTPARDARDVLAKYLGS